MSNIVQGLVWKADFPNPIAKLIAVKLADWADDEGGTIYPSAGKVAKRTGCAKSVVCKWQFAMEHCGLLKVVERGKGGNRSETTERAFDLDILKRLVAPNDATPAEAILVEDEIERESAGKDGVAKLVKVVVFRIEPVRQTDGLNSDDPSAKRTPPVRHTDSTRPRRGHNTKGIPKTTSARSRAKASKSDLKVKGSEPPPGCLLITRQGPEWQWWIDHLDKTDRALADRMRGEFMAYVPQRRPADGMAPCFPAKRAA